MFNKERFANILKRINNSYPTQTDFSDKTINRTNISQYINMRLDSPPKPNTLKKIAENSNGITDYDELMEVCGYKEMIEEYNLLINGDLKYLDLLFEGKEFLDEKDKIIELENLKTQLYEYIDGCRVQIDSLQKDELHRMISEDSIRNYKSDIRITKEKINGLQKIIDQLKELH